MPTHTRPVRLRVLLEQRHWQHHRTFSAEYERAALSIDRRLSGTAPSRAQLHRWLSGKLRGLPYGDHCRILERMFPQWSAKQLFEAVSVDEISDLTVAHPAGQEASARTQRSLLASIPHSFSATALSGVWLTCYQFDNAKHDIRCHADITTITPESDRQLTATNYPPNPRTQGQTLPFRNEIEAQLVNRHLIGHWKNVSDTRYFGSMHLAVLPGETIMEGYCTGLWSDIEVAAMSWKWIRLNPASLSGVELSQIVLKEPEMIYTLLEDPAYDAPLSLTDVVETSG